jgi:hypothetical protein
VASLLAVIVADAAAATAYAITISMVTFRSGNPSAAIQGRQSPARHCCWPYR